MKRLLKRSLKEVIEQAFVKFIGKTFEMVIDTGFCGDYLALARLLRTVVGKVLGEVNEEAIEEAFEVASERGHWELL